MFACKALQWLWRCVTETVTQFIISQSFKARQYKQNSRTWLVLYIPYTVHLNGLSCNDLSGTEKVPCLRKMLLVWSSALGQKKTHKMLNLIHVRQCSTYVYSRIYVINSFTDDTNLFQRPLQSHIEGILILLYVL